MKTDSIARRISGDDSDNESVQMYNDVKVYNDVDAYIDTYIGDLKSYRHLLQYMRRMEEDDKLTIWLTSDGGQIDSALAIIEAMQSSKGSVCVMASGHNASAATMIALSAPQIILGDHATMMFHSFSHGSYGKAGEVKTRMEFNHDWCRKMMWRSYVGFMSEEEFEKMMQGVDMYMDTSEIYERLERRHQWQLANGLVQE